jgi:transglutaminase-like putative cysteine protease
MRIRFSPLLRCACCFLFLLLLACEEEEPHIASIDPRIGMMGEILTIRGERFGAERDESYITIAGIAPTASSYITWEDTQISLRLPEFGEAGLIYVHRGNKKSNAILFSNRITVPRISRDADVGIGPRILSVDPVAGQIGSLITILGSGFGTSRDGSGVFFAWDAENSPTTPAEVSGPESVETAEIEFGYELWNEREIRVRIPDGAISGNLVVSTPRGISQPVFFDVTGKPGTKIYRDKRSYAISYTVDIQVQEASGLNALYLWLPRPVSSASQRNVQSLSRSMEPFIDNYRGTSLFQLNNLGANTGAGITLSYLVEVYSIETGIRTQAVRQSGGSTISTAYTLPSPLIPSDDPGLKAAAADITGREQNPYIKAQKIYEWLITEGGIRREALRGGAIEALEHKQADPYMAALLFCSLARAAGVPALPVAGILIDRNHTTSRHYWAEFWIDEFGWIPLDPALGAGAAPPAFNLRPDRASYYFGNLDNQRVSFSRGQTLLSQMDSQGRVAVRERDYALQTLWEEAVGELESYSSLWGDVTINGVYAQ